MARERFRMAAKMLKSSLHAYAQIQHARGLRIARAVADPSSAIGPAWANLALEDRRKCEQLVLMAPPSLLFAVVVDRCFGAVLDPVWRAVVQAEDTLTVDLSPSAPISRLLLDNAASAAPKLEFSTVGADWARFRDGDAPPLQIWNQGPAFLLSSMQPGVWQQPQLGDIL
jgi:hypothetical protein